MTPPDMGEAFLMGILAGLAVMSFYTARTAIAITKSGRWPDFMRLAGVRYH